MYDILSGSVKLNNIFGALLMEVNAEVMPPWQRYAKRFMDIILSLIESQTTKCVLNTVRRKE